ncbi:MAG: DUF4097 domain-containing protein [Clostridiales bacterium]|jgi:hypothetical protein|nr:DUF4097 domain-containing protein [Clostridiales bacterium]
MKTFSKIWLRIGLVAIVLGLGLLVLALILRTDKDIYAPVYTIDKTYEDIERLHIDISYGKVEIIEGDEFRIQGENLLDGEFETYVENGTWYIKDDYKTWFSFLDLGMTLRGTVWNKGIVPKIRITLPEDYVAERITLKVRAGEVEADVIHARKGDFSVDAGRLEIASLQVLENSYYHVGAGEMVVDYISANDVKINCGVGDVRIDGIITGNSTIENNIGSVELNLFGKQEDYSYDVNTNIGDVIIDGESIGGLAQHRKIDNKVGNSLTINCDIGKVIIYFRENYSNI